MLALFALLLGPGLGMLTLLGVPLLLILVFGPPIVRVVRRRRAGRDGAGSGRRWAEAPRATAGRAGAGRALMDGVSSSGARLRRALGDDRGVQPRRRPRL